MAATKFAIVIASETKAIRRAIYPDDDAELDRISLIKGETALLFSVKESGDLDQWKALVEKATGVSPPDPLCAIVENGMVASVILADPKLDPPPEGKELVAAYSEEIAPGDTYDRAQDVFIKSGQTIEKPAITARLK